MTGFIETSSSGGMVPISAIVRIGEEFSGKDKARGKLRTAKLFDGSKFDLFEHDISDLRMRAAQIIPSLPGIKYLKLALAPDKKDSSIVDEPVIAWALCLDGAVRPVTPQGVCGGASFWDDHYVEVATGAIYSVGGDSEPSRFDDRDEMLRDFVADRGDAATADADAPHAALFAEWTALQAVIGSCDKIGDEDMQPNIDRLIAVENEMLAAALTRPAQAKIMLRLIAKISEAGVLLDEKFGKSLADAAAVLA